MNRTLPVLVLVWFLNRKSEYTNFICSFDWTIKIEIALRPHLKFCPNTIW
jgi:hypothetical protein